MNLIVQALVLVAVSQALTGEKVKRDYYISGRAAASIASTTESDAQIDDGGDINNDQGDFDNTRTFRRRRPHASHASLIKNHSQRHPDGSYNYEFLTDNGIHRQETSQQLGLDRVVRGSYSYIGPDGQTYTVNYVADRNGYRAYGAHLPTQPDAVANIINQAQQGVLSTTGQYVPLHSTTIAPIYSRRPGHYVTSTTQSPHQFVSTTFAPPTTPSTGVIYTTTGGSPFVSTTSNPFSISPSAQGFGSTINPFNSNAFSNGVPTSTPSPFLGVTTPSPFDNEGTVNITPLPHTFVGQRYPATGSSASSSFGIPSGFQNQNGLTNPFQNTGFNGFNGGQPEVFQNGFNNQNNGLDNFSFAANPFQQLPFAQSLGQFNGGQFSNGQFTGGQFGGPHQQGNGPFGRRQFDAASVQPLAPNHGFGASIASIPPSAFDRVNVNRG